MLVFFTCLALFTALVQCQISVPNDVKIVNVTDSQVTVTWKAGSNQAAAFNVRIDTRASTSEETTDTRFISKPSRRVDAPSTVSPDDEFTTTVNGLQQCVSLQVGVAIVYPNSELSSEAVVQFETLPKAVSIPFGGLLAEGYAANTIRVSWTAVTLPCTYTYRLEWKENFGDGTDLSYRDYTTAGIEYLITGLKPDTAYNFTITVTAFPNSQVGPKSDPVTAYTFPGTPSEVLNLHAADVTSESFTLEWEPPAFPNGRISHYEMSFSDGLFVKRFSLPGNRLSIPFSGLQVYTAYTASVTARTQPSFFGYGGGLGKPKFVQVVTSTFLPSAPLGLTGKVKSPTAVQLSWLPPARVFEIIQSYSIKAVPTVVTVEHAAASARENDRRRTLFESSLSSNTTYLFTDLAPFVNYTFDVAAEVNTDPNAVSTSTGTRSAPISVFTPPAAPEKRRNLTIISVTNQSTEISWNLSPTYGNMIFQTVKTWRVGTSINDPVSKNDYWEQKVSDTETKATLTHLEPCYSYHIGVTGTNAPDSNGIGGGESSPVVIQVTIPTGIVNMTSDMFALNINPTTQSIFWKAVPFSCSITYELQYRIFSTAVNTEIITTIYENPNVFYTLPSLEEATLYIYRMRTIAYPGGLVGPYTNWRKLMPTLGVEVKECESRRDCSQNAKCYLRQYNLTGADNLDYYCECETLYYPAPFNEVPRGKTCIFALEFVIIGVTLGILIFSVFFLAVFHCARKRKWLKEKRKTQGQQNDYIYNEETEGHSSKSESLPSNDDELSENHISQRKQFVKEDLE